MRESTEHAESLDDAERKALALARAWSTPDFNRRSEQWKHIAVFPRLDNSIMSKPLDPFAINVSIESVAFKDGDWVLILHGYWTARITLSTDYQMKTSEHVPNGTPAYR